MEYGYSAQLTAEIKPKKKVKSKSKMRRQSNKSAGNPSKGAGFLMSGSNSILIDIFS
jgi:hypothetical protein